MSKSRSYRKKSMKKSDKTRSHRSRKLYKGCPLGSIRRKAYSAKRKSGKSYYVASSCIKERGRKGPTRGGSPKRIKLPKPTKGALSKYGYALDLPQTMRRRALRKAVEKEGTSTIIKRLNYFYTLNKNKPEQKENCKKSKNDEAYVRTLKE
jgi:hypothetical protein